MDADVLAALALGAPGHAHEVRPKRVRRPDIHGLQREALAEILVGHRGDGGLAARERRLHLLLQRRHRGRQPLEDARVRRLVGRRAELLQPEGSCSPRRRANCQHGPVAAAIRLLYGVLVEEQLEHRQAHRRRRAGPHQAVLRLRGVAQGPGAEGLRQRPALRPARARRPSATPRGRGRRRRLRARNSYHPSHAPSARPRGG